MTNIKRITDICCFMNNIILINVRKISTANEIFSASPSSVITLWLMLYIQNPHVFLSLKALWFNFFSGNLTSRCWSKNFWIFSGKIKKSANRRENLNSGLGFHKGNNHQSINAINRKFILHVFHQQKGKKFLKREVIVLRISQLTDDDESGSHEKRSSNSFSGETFVKSKRRW